jgi:hypothetical protein
MADVLQAVDEDRVAGEQIGVFIDLLREGLDEDGDAVESSGGSMDRPPMRK